MKAPGKGFVALSWWIATVALRVTALARRLDVASAIDRRLRSAGIQIRLALRPDPDRTARHRLCIWTDDSEYGRRLPPDPQLPLLCDVVTN